MSWRPKKKLKRLTLKDVKDIRSRVKKWGSEEYATYLSSAESLQSKDRKLADDFLSILCELRLLYDAFLPDEVMSPSAAFSYIETQRQQLSELTFDKTVTGVNALRKRTLARAEAIIQSLLTSSRSSEEKMLATLVLVDLVVTLHKREHESERDVFELYEAHNSDLHSFVEKMFKNFR